jgi:hypothetical protein
MKKLSWRRGDIVLWNLWNSFAWFIEVQAHCLFYQEGNFLVHYFNLQLEVFQLQRYFTGACVPVCHDFSQEGLDVPVKINGAVIFCFLRVHEDPVSGIQAVSSASMSLFEAVILSKHTSASMSSSSAEFQGECEH